ncbi:putative transmembrane protein [Planoprotostelium fungivorum]|uniref:Putative transmembrane protein n=1 Tax=Planoprotostelium fungivorum TaxID=1890364 RepID=A0A2P6MZ81_9EUKA|nr:putative transmembrane protein [Planoprotostelium fungivorum]
MKLSSLPFQILLFFNRWFSVAYVILEISILIWKKFQMPYPGTSFAGEICFLFLYMPIEAIRNFLGEINAHHCLALMPEGTRGNKLIDNRSLVAFIFLSIPSSLCYAYFLRWQIYVLTVDVALNCIGIGINGIQALICFGCMIIFARTR